MSDLKQELQKVRDEQQSNREAKGGVINKIKQLDEQVKYKIKEMQASRQGMSFKTVSEVDDRIASLENEIERGAMKLIDEKQALKDISKLRAVRKQLGAVSGQQSSIDTLKSQIDALRKSLDDPETKSLESATSKLQKELDALKLQSSDWYAKRQALYDEKQAMNEKRQQAYQNLKKIEDEYHTSRKAYQKYEREEREKRMERERAAQDEFYKQKRMKDAEKRMEEAKQPAYVAQIATCESLIRFFEQSTKKSESKSEETKSDAKITKEKEEEGVLFVRKDDNLFVGTNQKKKKSRKEPRESKWSLSVGILEDLRFINVDPPIAIDEVPQCLEKLQKKIEFFQENQEQATKENIAKAIEKNEEIEQNAEKQAKQRRSDAEKRNQARQKNRNQASKPSDQESDIPNQESHVKTNGIA